MNGADEIDRVQGVCPTCDDLGVVMGDGEEVPCPSCQEVAAAGADASPMLLEAARLVMARVDPRDVERREEALRAARVCMESRRTSVPCAAGTCFVCTVYRLWENRG